MADTTALLPYLLRREVISREQAMQVLSAMRDTGKSVEETVIELGLCPSSQLDHYMKEIAPPPSKPGLEVPGYHLSDALGEGGMGVVYEAEQTGVGRTVALKILAPHYASDQEFVQRFLREGRNASAINSPYVVQVYDAGRHGETLYIAQEFMSGGDIDYCLAAYPDGLPVDRVLQVLIDCSRGLVAIEQAGLVHRDIKPSNILLDDQGTAKLADFGLSRTVSYEDKISQSGDIFGTPAYMSPEHAQGSLDLDIRTDIYSLAATAYAMLTGRQPYEGRSVWDTVAKVINDPPPVLRDARADVPASLCDLIRVAMSKDRAQRPSGPADFLRDLEAIQELGRLTPNSAAHFSRLTDDLTLRFINQTMIIAPSGVLGSGDLGAWRSLIDGVSERNLTHVLVDGSSIDWMSSEGLALLVKTNKACEKSGLNFGIAGLNKSTRESLELVNLHMILNLYDNLDEAMQAA
jgi:anti-anti-sigma factor